jgi:hypothetical protein
MYLRAMHSPRSALIALTVLLLLALPAGASAAPTWIAPAATLSAAGNGFIGIGPYVATNSRGDTAVAWLDPLTGRAKVSERPVGGVFSQGVTVNGSADQYLGGVSIDGAGNMYAFLIVNNSNPMTSRPVVATKPIGSGLWSSDFLADADSADPPQGGITGAVTPGGKALVTWFQGHTADASQSKLEFAVKPAGSSTWGPKANVPGVTGNTSQHQLVMNAAGEAALAYTKVVCSGLSSYLVFGATMSSGNAWTTANQIPACNGAVDVSVTGFSVGIDGSGNATAAWTHHNGANDIVQYSTKAIGAPSWPTVPLTSPTNDLSPSPGIATAPGLAVAPDGTTTVAWGRGNSVEERTRAGVGGAFAGATTIPNALTSPQRPVLGAAADGSVVAAWPGTNATPKQVIGSARRAPAADSFDALPGAPGTDNAMPALGVDEEGNASAAWVHTATGPQYSVQATGLDVAGPAITNLTFPATATAGTAFPYGATLTDRWSSASGEWELGDGTTGPLSGTKAYASAGSFDAVLTATDSHGNVTTADRSILVSKPAGGAGGGGGGGAGGGGTTPDATPPVLVSAAVSNVRFRIDRNGAAEPLAGAAARRGTTFLYELSEAATVRFAIRRRQPGRRVAGKCVKPTRSNRGKRRCARFVKVGAFTHAGSAGANAKAFSGKLGTRRLRVGRYRVRLTAVDAAGNRSAPKVLAIRVVRR